MAQMLLSDLSLTSAAETHRQASVSSASVTGVTPAGVQSQRLSSRYSKTQRGYKSLFFCSEQILQVCRTGLFLSTEFRKCEREKC